MKTRTFAIAALVCTTLTSHAIAQQIYRGMRPDPANAAVPLVANTALGLGVRPADVVATPAGIVLPHSPNPPNAPQGTSVVTAGPCGLPAFTRPSGGNWNGTGAPTLQVWTMAQANLPATLQVQAVAAVPPVPNHAVISTVGAGLTQALFQAAVGGTQAHWVIQPPPPAACP